MLNKKKNNKSYKLSKRNSTVLIDLKYQLKQLLEQKSEICSNISDIRMRIKTINKSRMNSNTFNNIKHIVKARENNIKKI